MAPLFGPRQLGVIIRGGCEAAIHSARRYLQSLAPGHVMVKLDFANAFNSLHRSDMLLSVRDRLPELYAFCLSSYSQPSFLYFGSHVILSQEGPQQGDLLGPLLFCSTIHPIITSLSSDLTLGYLDDLTLAGPQSVVQHLLLCSPSVDNPALDLFYGHLRSALSHITNTSLSDTQRLQASLHIKHGGLGIRQVCSLALPAFLASAASTSDLQSLVLLASACTTDTHFDTYLADWQGAHPCLLQTLCRSSSRFGTNQVFCPPVQPWSQPFLTLARKPYSWRRRHLIVETGC